MAIYKVYSDNAVFQGFEVLRTNRNKRHKRRAFIVEGVRNIDAAARYGWHFEAFITCGGGANLSRWARDMIAAHGDVDIYELTPDLMKKLSAKTDTSELVAIARMRGDIEDIEDDGTVAAPGSSGNNLLNECSNIRNECNYLQNEGSNIRNECCSSYRYEVDNGGPIYVLSDRPSGKGNLGTLMRSCDAFGVKALYRTGHSVDFYDPEVIAATMGSFFAVPFYALSDTNDVDKLIERLRAEHPGLIVAGTSAHGSQQIYETDLTGPVLLLIGNEADGLSWRLKQAADVMAAIPMSGGAFASSLNVSCAATAILYEVHRQRRIG